MGSLRAVGDDNDNSDAVPKLTIGQRLLTSLPDLQKKNKVAPEPDPEADLDDEEASDPDASAEPGESGTASRKSPAATGPVRRGKSSGLTAPELTHAIKRLDDRERFLAMTSVPIGIAVVIVLTTLQVHFNPAVNHKGHLPASTIIFLEGGVRLLLCGVVLGAAYTRRRSFVGFALLFLGTSLELPFALPFWGLGGWLIWRVFKYQRELAALNPRARGAAGNRSSGRGSAAATTRTAKAKSADRPRTMAEARAAGAARNRRKKQPVVPGPPPSKRYTPPKPVRPKPPAPS